jgi:acetoin utilization deacetylase AcuC-like enzyme
LYNGPQTTAAKEASMSVGLVHDPIYQEHDTGPHVESPSRLKRLEEHLRETSMLEKLVTIKPRAAAVEELTTIHSPGYISYVENFVQRDGGWLDPDTVVSSASYNVALYAAGGLLEAVDAVMEGKVSSAFAAVRPPGHHAIRWEAMGFCIFNNVAVAAVHATETHKLERVLIADFDVHHGNGTQDAFYQNPHVMYFSTHQYPFYPGTGRVEETGEEAGVGATVNVPMPAYCGDDEYLRVFDEVLVPASRRFEPQLILVSAGYDPHWADSISMMQVSTTGFAGMVRVLKGLADELCGGKLVFTLEGGYNLDALASSIKATLDALLGAADIADPLGLPGTSRGAPDIDSLLQAVKETHRLD